ncbi:chitinase [Pseudonocardiaceae bacterium YIM PH 21723]|nr:chitinase [Pseudonocardiaceae bacterium YIM PH 21723]
MNIMGVAATADDCRPDGLASGVTGVNYCLNYDKDGREKLANGATRRTIGYFTSWRNGANGLPTYLVNNIPWDKVTHLNYAFAHIDKSNKVSVGDDNAQNPSTGMEWPGVPGAEMDPSLPYKGHFNLLTKLKKQHPDVKTLVSIGGWAETGGILNPDGSRDATGGFYKITQDQASINTFADSTVEFLRKYGFNGADIDYEYATSANFAGNPDDFDIAQANRGKLVAGYISLMKTLREKLDAASKADNKYYSLTAAVSGSGWLLRGVETYQVTQYLDYANVMSYDLHGSWNQYVGPNASLFDDGKDAEQKFWDVYTTPQYEGAGYLNTDWAYHYFRGAMPAGRINIGVGFYTRGWQGVTGGTNGLWGTAPLPDQKQCPKGTGASVNSKVPCGNGAIGIDNLWHDNDLLGKEVPSGVNPMWHAKNLEKGITPDYLAKWGLDPSKPENQVKGTYARNYDSTLVAPWLFNSEKKVFLTTEDEESLKTKAKYVADKGIGGIMIWELAGDYAFDQTANGGKGQYGFGTTMIDTINDGLKGAKGYGNLKANATQPTSVIKGNLEFTGFALGDNNYPINPTLKLTNNGTTAIAANSTVEFDYGVTNPGSMTDQGGMGLQVTKKDHTGANVGGYKGDFQHVKFTLKQALAAGQSTSFKVQYYMPMASPSNVKITSGSTSYALSSDWPRGYTG